MDRRSSLLEQMRRIEVLNAKITKFCQPAKASALSAIQMGRRRKDVLQLV